MILKRNINKFPNKKIPLIALFFCLSLTVYSQSRYLEDGIGGSAFGFNTFISADGLDAVGLSAAYSIGGKMDFGFELNRENGRVNGVDSTVWNFDFVYNLIVIKQTEYVPLSLQLESGYGFSNYSSDNFSDPIESYEGQGFNLGASIFREFNSNGIISFLIGGKALYQNTNYTTTYNDGTVQYIKRIEDFSYGGIAAISLKPARWPIFTIELEALYSQDAGGVYLQPSLLIISPSF